MSEASLDSVAVFEERAKEVGFRADDIARIKNEGIGTLAKFGFACKYSPGQQDESSLAELGKTIFAEDPVSVSRMAALRRLYFEAYTLSAAELRRKLEATSDSKPVRLANPERKQRADEQAARLKGSFSISYSTVITNIYLQVFAGVKIVGELEPSHALVDKAVKIYEDNVLTRIPWAEVELLY